MHGSEEMSEEKDAQEAEKLHELVQTSIEQYQPAFSPRVKNALARTGIRTIRDLMTWMSEQKLMRQVSGIHAGSTSEIVQKLSVNGLYFGMQIPTPENEATRTTIGTAISSSRAKIAPIVEAKS